MCYTLILYNILWHNNFAAQGIKGVMIPALYPDRDPDFQLFCGSGSGF